MRIHHQTTHDGPRQTHMVTIAMDPGEVDPSNTQAISQRIMQQLGNLNLPVMGPSFQASVHGQPVNLGSAGIGGNPANFAWGANGMQNILDRLLQEAGNDGSARPASEQTISQIESSELTSRQINSMKDSNTCECSICMGEFQVGTIVKKLPPCNHTFHCDCIDSWLRLHNTCPICRSEVQVNSSAPYNSGAAGQAQPPPTPGSGETDEDAGPSEPPPSYFS